MLLGHLRLGADDIHFVAILKFRHQRHDTTVDLGAHAAIANIGMDRIGKIDWCRSTRQRNQAALRREAENLILKQLKLCMF